MKYRIKQHLNSEMRLDRSCTITGTTVSCPEKGHAKEDFMKKTVFVLLCFAVSGMLSACGGPRYVVDTTSREKSIKFMYVGDEGQGVLQCDKA